MIDLLKKIQTHISGRNQINDTELFQGWDIIHYEYHDGQCLCGRSIKHNYVIGRDDVTLTKYVIGYR